MSLHIKICGITNPTDAVAAASAGADALGLVFAPSPRHVTLDEARNIRIAVPMRTELVGVFVDEPFALVHDAILTAGLGGVQFHHNPSDMWSPDELHRWNHILLARRIRFVRAFRARNADSLRADLGTLPTNIDQVLLDAFVPGAEGGTGKTFDWTLVEIAKQARYDVIVAGGLTPDNVAEAVRLARPWGVDVSSGVESSPGRKDPEAVRRFIANGQAVD